MWRTLGETTTNCGRLLKGHRHLWNPLARICGKLKMLAKVVQSGRVCRITVRAQKASVRAFLCCKRLFVLSEPSLTRRSATVNASTASYTPYRELPGSPISPQRICSKKWRTISFFDKFVWSGEGGSRTRRTPAKELSDYKSAGLASCPTSPHKIGGPGGNQTHVLPRQKRKLYLLSYRPIGENVRGSRPTRVELASSTCESGAGPSQLRARSAHGKFKISDTLQTMLAIAGKVMLR